MNGKHVLDGMPQTFVHGAEESAGRIAEAVETAGARMAKEAKLNVKDAQLSIREKKLGVMQNLTRSIMKRQAAMARRQGRIAKRQAKLLPSAGADALLKAELVRTSRELAHESSDLNAAVISLNKIIQANRRTAAKSRTRLLGGLAMGAALMYHLDAERGHQRRAATAQMLTRMVRGQHQPPAAS
jgi:hypothetical protein